MTTAKSDPRFHVLVVDDEQLARQRIQHLVRPFSDLVVIGEAATGPAAVEAIRGLEPDVVFLDIELPEMNGMAVVGEVGVEEMPMTVFVTAHNEYAIEAFEAHALDYLLKPVSSERFTQTVHRIRARAPQRAAGGNEGLKRLLEEWRGGPEPEDRLVVRNGNRLVLIEVGDIQAITAEANYLRIHTPGRTHLLRETMTGMAERLDSNVFVRIHRSALVRISAIAELESVLQGEYLVVLKNGLKLTSSRKYRHALEQAVRIR